MNATGSVDAGFVAAVIVVLLVPAILAALKGRWWLLGLGLLLGLLAASGRQAQGQSTTGGFGHWLGAEAVLWLPLLIGAVRLARPGSVWFQRWYDGEKQDRARTRFARKGRSGPADQSAVSSKDPDRPSPPGPSVR